MLMEGITVQEMRDLEEKRFQEGLDIMVLMERVGKNCAEIIEERYGRGKWIVVFCGPGNNGGDGYVCARYLSGRNDVGIVMAAEPKTTPAKANYEKAKDLIVDSVEDADIIVDAMLGTGQTPPLRGRIKELCKKINRMKGFKVAIDVPSGKDADSGETDEDFVRCDATICLHAPKIGVLKAGNEKTGELWTIDIGI